MKYCPTCNKVSHEALNLNPIQKFYHVALILIVTFLFFDRCAFAEILVNDVNHLKKVSTFFLIDPEVTVSVLDGNNNATLLPDETSLMLKTIKSELEYNLNKKGYDLKIQTRAQYDETKSNETPLREFLNEYLKSKNKSGRVPSNYLGTYYKTDAIIFVQSHSHYYDANATTSSNLVAGVSTAASLVFLGMPVAAFSSNNQGGIFIIMIEPKTGTIIWRGQAGAIDWDFRSSGRMTKMIEELFFGFPEAERKNIQSGLIKKRSEILKENESVHNLGVRNVK